MSSLAIQPQRRPTPEPSPAPAQIAYLRELVKDPKPTGERSLTDEDRSKLGGLFFEGDNSNPPLGFATVTRLAGGLVRLTFQEERTDSAVITRSAVVRLSSSPALISFRKVTDREEDRSPERITVDWPRGEIPPRERMQIENALGILVIPKQRLHRALNLLAGLVSADNHERYTLAASRADLAAFRFREDNQTIELILGRDVTDKRSLDNAPVYLLDRTSLTVRGIKSSTGADQQISELSPPSENAQLHVLSAVERIDYDNLDAYYSPTEYNRELMQEAGAIVSSLLRSAPRNTWMPHSQDSEFLVDSTGKNLWYRQNRYPGRMYLVTARGIVEEVAEASHTVSRRPLPSEEFAIVLDSFVIEGAGTAAALKKPARRK